MNNSPEKKIYIDTYITTTNGCRFHVTGWVDVSITIRPVGVGVNSYDIMIDGPCGKFHIKETMMQAPINDNDDEFSDEVIRDILRKIINDNL